MKRLLPLLALLASCAPQQQAQRVQVWEGEARVLLRQQSYRLTFTVGEQTHDLRGQLQNRTSGDTFLVAGTLLPTPGGAALTAEVTVGEGVKLSASLLGFGVSGVPLKADALLTGSIKGDVLDGSLRVLGVAYPLVLRRVQ